MIKNIYAKFGLAALMVFTTIHLFIYTPAHYKNQVLSAGGRLRSNKTSSEPLTELEQVYKNAGNGTLGFEKVLFINIPSRYDRADALTLQSQLTGLQFETRDAVPLQQLEEKKLIGMAPSSSNSLNSGQYACMRSHANAWREMLDKGWNSMVVLESDATWDMNIRDITKRMAKAVHELIDREQLHLDKNSKPSEHDPWDVNNWDFINFGACMESHRRSDIYIKYSDIDSPDARYLWEEERVNVTLRDERIVRQSGSPVCTGAYAISRTGALKFLLRQAVDANTPVDLMIAEMVREGRALAFVPFPPLIYQWEYVKGIGAENRNSDIDFSRKTQNTDDQEQRWKEVRKEWNVWSYNGMFSSKPFKHWALAEMHKYILPFA